MVRPNKPMIDKLREMVAAWGNDEVARWDFDRVKRLAGLLSYIAGCLDSRKARPARWRRMGSLRRNQKCLRELGS